MSHCTSTIIWRRKQLFSHLTNWKLVHLYLSSSCRRTGTLDQQSLCNSLQSIARHRTSLCSVAEERRVCRRQEVAVAAAAVAVEVRASRRKSATLLPPLDWWLPNQKPLSSPWSSPRAAVAAAAGRQPLSFLSALLSVPLLPCRWSEVSQWGMCGAEIVVIFK